MSAMVDRFDVIVRRATLVSGQGMQQGDIGIADGRIAEIGDLARFSAAHEVDALGKHVLPGGIDTQVHFREPGMEHKENLESGTRAAIVGGITSIFEMPNTNPVTTSREALEDKLRRANGRASCDYAFFVGASTENTADLAALEMLPGTPGIKMFAGSSTGGLLVSSEADQRAVLQHGVRPVAIHSEDEPRLSARRPLVQSGAHVREHPHARDVESAVISTVRLLRLAEETGRPIHILHISTAAELELISQAKRRGVKVTCEATPQHLTLGMEDYESLGTRVQMNPPIRGGQHRDALWEAVLSGLVDVLGSDHAPHTAEEKARPYPQSPSGMTGVQTTLPIMLDWVNEGRIALERVVQLLMENPAKLFGIKNKGRLEPGFDADLVLIDLDRRWTITDAWIESRSQWTPYDRRDVTGFVDSVFLRGRAVVQGGQHLDRRLGRPVEFTWK